MWPMEELQFSALFHVGFVFFDFTSPKVVAGS